MSVDDVFRCAKRLPPDVEKYVLDNLQQIRRSMLKRAAA